MLALVLSVLAFIPFELDRVHPRKVSGNCAKSNTSIHTWVWQTAEPVAARRTETGSQTGARSTQPLLPLLDELRTYCYEHQIEEVPVLLAI